jgi:protein tyrosine/serine phosphatase
LTLLTGVDSFKFRMTVVAPKSSKPRVVRNAGIAIGSIALLVIAGLVVWNNGLRDRLLPKNFGVVEPGKLYRSGQISHWQIEQALKDNGIKVIVALSGHGGKQADLDAELKASSELGIDREVFPLGGDGTGQIEQYAKAIALIDASKKQGKPVLVHCIAGAQRTGGVIATYEMLVEHKPPSEAFVQMREYGHDPTANPHLLEFLNSHMAELAQKLVDRGVISRVPDPVPQLVAE